MRQRQGARADMESAPTL